MLMALSPLRKHLWLELNEPCPQCNPAEAKMEDPPKEGWPYSAGLDKVYSSGHKRGSEESGGNEREHRENYQARRKLQAQERREDRSMSDATNVDVVRHNVDVVQRTYGAVGRGNIP